MPHHDGEVLEVKDLRGHPRVLEAVVAAVEGAQARQGGHLPMQRHQAVAYQREAFLQTRGHGARQTVSAASAISRERWKKRAQEERRKKDGSGAFISRRRDEVARVLVDLL